MKKRIAIGFLSIIVLMSMPVSADSTTDRFTANKDGYVDF
ncbi:MAG: hypothetical protein HeimC3_32250 [Candidatus Heimdallarchaeota archaeon LC_3]|nr:MAG: hypothetical protein HeimC3_32250 [Candidatus Heimdallarchaeota archaeon LC_3]